MGQQWSDQDGWISIQDGSSTIQLFVDYVNKTVITIFPPVPNADQTSCGEVDNEFETEFEMNLKVFTYYRFITHFVNVFASHTSLVLNPFTPWFAELKPSLPITAVYLV